jgi:thiol-disulfide isomerase/thioredoxin
MVAILALWIFVFLLAIVVVGLLRRLGDVLEQAEASLRTGQSTGAAGGAPVGADVPRFRVLETTPENVAPREMASEELLRELSILLFMGEECGPCRHLAPELESVDALLQGVPLFVIVPEHDRTREWLPGNVPVLYEVRGEVTRAFENTATPQAYLVDEDHVIRAKRIVGSVAHLKALAESIERIQA